VFFSDEPEMLANISDKLHAICSDRERENDLNAKVKNGVSKLQIKNQ